MADLQQTDPKLNVYFQNKRIRQHLIKTGFINRRGDILPPPSDEVVRTRPQSKKKTSKPIDKHVAEDEQKNRVVSRSQLDLSVKHTRVEKTKRLKKSRRAISPSLSNLRDLPSSANTKSSISRAKSAHSLSHNSKKRSVSTSAKTKSPTAAGCRVEMIYYGPHKNIDQASSWLQPEGDEILVSQQHCGGENLTVFKGHVKPNEKFEFDSRRHPDYPFALALYVNNLFDSRISVCCEYKHKPNVRLGGKHGLFGITNVFRVKPCKSCRYKRRKRKSKLTAALTLEPSRYQKSVVPRLSSRSSSHSPPVRRTPTPPRNLLKTKCRSPDISQTPTPPPQEDNKKPLISSANRNLRVVPTDYNSNTQTSTASQNNGEENYSSDFDESDDDERPTANTRFGRPRISDSHSIENQGDSDNPPRPSSGISKKSGLPKDKDHNHTSQILTNNNDTDRLASYSSVAARKSGPSNSKSDHDVPKVLTGRNNNANRPRSSSSETSRKSGPSPRYEVKRELNENNNKTRFSSTTASKNDNEDRRLPSNSDDDNLTRSSAKNNNDTNNSSNIHRTWTSARDDFFGNNHRRKPRF